MTVLEVFADVSCPYAHVQLRQLMSVRSEGSVPSFRLRSWPLELVNGGAVDHASLGQGVAALRALVDPGLFAGFDATHGPDTFLPALDLEQAAWRQDPAIGEQVSLQLRDAFFVDGRDISDPAVLESIAAHHNLATGPSARGRPGRLERRHSARRRRVAALLLRGTQRVQPGPRSVEGERREASHRDHRSAARLRSRLQRLICIDASTGIVTARVHCGDGCVASKPARGWSARHGRCLR